MLQHFIEKISKIIFLIVVFPFNYKKYYFIFTLVFYVQSFI